MKQKSVAVAGIGLLLMGIAACDPSPTGPDVTLSLLEPTEGSSPSLTFDAKVAIDGDFELVESGCDATDISVDPDWGIIVPEWDPYDCSDEDGIPPEGEGNVQLFVDGIFHAMSASTTIPVDLTPKIALAEYTDDPNGDGMGLDADGDGFGDLFVLCYYYFPDDNLGYASSLFNEAMFYTSLDFYGVPLYDPSTLEPLDPQPAIADVLYYFDAPFLYFDYAGSANEGQHIFYPELHHTNFEPVYGVNRPRTITGQFDLTQMPADWCGVSPMY